MDPRALLRHNPRFAALDDDTLSQIARRAANTEVPAGHILVDRTSSPQRAYVIVEGWAAATVRDEPIAALGPGDLIDHALIAGYGQPTAKVLAKTPMRLLVLDPVPTTIMEVQQP